MSVSAVQPTTGSLTVKTYQDIDEKPRENMLDKLRVLWAEVLQQDPSDYSEQDVFFEVGGDSISALELAAAAQGKDILLTIEQIFTHPALGEMVQETRVVDFDKEKVSIVSSPEPFALLRAGNLLQDQIQAIAQACGVCRESVQNAYPCTPMQEALFATTEGNENAYVMQMVYELADHVPLDRFQQSWCETIYANPILRTRVCHLKSLGYIQAVIDENPQWRYPCDLTRFLQEDASLPMHSGSPFSRYTIVTEGGARYFIWTLHHALCDGASVLELLNEVSQRFCLEPPPPRQAFDRFVESTTMGTDFMKQRDFWRASLSGIDATIYPQLPHPDFQPNPSSILERCIVLEHPPPFGLTKALLLRAAWAILLSHHTGNEDIVFGTIVNGRSSSTKAAGLAYTTGPTINLIPIAMAVDPKQPLASFLAKVRDQAAELLAFEHSGLSNIRRHLPVGSTACGFQSLFVVHPTNFSDALSPALQKLGLRCAPRIGKTEKHPYPLVISCTISSDAAIAFKMEYDEAVIPDQHANNIINQLHAVLEQLCIVQPDVLLGTISSLSAEDEAHISQWNQSTHTVVESCFHQLFEQQVYRQPTAEALCSLDNSLSYAEVENISSALALHLVELGTCPESFVAICFEKSIWAIVAILAVFKAGSAYVPIDPTHPRGRIREVIGMAHVNVALTSNLHIGVLEGLCPNIVPVHDLPLSYIPRRPTGAGVSAQPSNTAYLLFTSGSTGKPKGVVIQHSALCSSMMSYGAAFGVDASSRVLQFAPLTFDASVVEVFATLAFGGTVCVPTDHDRLNNLPGAITALNVNTAVITPTVANLLVPDEVPTLRKMTLGGEPVTKDIVLKWAHRVCLSNGYGPSETTVCCGGNIGVSSDTHPANIGRSIGATMWIVNAGNHHQLSAIGCVGEIAVSGPLLAKGYFADEAATDASFVLAPDWLSTLDPACPYRRIYKTGDLARYNADGTFQFVGRKDTQVKLRGFRIELGEIESRMMDHGTVTAALAILPSEGPCARQIIAVLSFNRLDLGHQSGSDIALLSETEYAHIKGLLEEVQSRLSFTLPDYMIPSAWVVLERVPLLVSGKIDRKAIKSWVNQMSPELHKTLVGNCGLEDPTNILQQGTPEHILQQCWSEVLNVPIQQINAKTSFFSLGGDSISAIQVVSKAKKRGLSVTVRGILSGKTLATVVKMMKQHEPNAPKLLGQLGVGVPRLPLGPFDITPIQRFFIESNTEHLPSVRFHQALVLRPRRAVPADKLEEAFSVVVQRHPMLRTVFLEEYQWQRQQTIEEVDGSFRFHEHGRLTSSEVRQAIANGHVNISISKGPVFSVDVWETVDGTELLVTGHHLVIDLVSWRIILQEVEDYLSSGSFSAPPSFSFYQWSSFLQSRFGTEHTMLDNYENTREPVLELFGLDGFQNSYADLQSAAWNLDAAATREFLETANQEVFAEPVEVMIASIARSFAHTFGRSCPDIFVEGHGREPLDTGIDLSSTVGWFTVLYPIDHFPAEAASLTEHVRAVRSARRAFPDNGLEYFSRMLLGANRSPQLQARCIQFNYQGAYHQFESDNSLFEMVDYPELESTLIGPEVKRTSIFEIEAAIRGDQLRFSISFPRALGNTILVMEWFQTMKETLEGFGSALQNERRTSSPGPLRLFQSSNGDTPTYDEQGLLSHLGGPPSAGIEDVYPCSPMQREILKQQRTDPSVFRLSWRMEISSRSGPIDVEKVAQSWRGVVQKHPILRTVFVEDPDKKKQPFQVVLTQVEPEVVTYKAGMGIGLLFEEPPMLSLHKYLLPHRVRFYQHGNSVGGLLEATHAILDGWSLGLLREDLLAAYDMQETKDTREPTVYKPFITAHRKDRVETDNQYWARTLLDQVPTLLSLPKTSRRSETLPGTSSGILDLPALDARSLGTLCAQHGITTASIFDAAWAQTLSIYTQSPDVSFGYIVSGRDQEIPGVLQIVGPLINVLAYHLRGISTENSAPDLIELARTIQEQRVHDGQYSYSNIQEILEHDMGGVGKVFNTAVNFQRRSKALAKYGLKIEDLEGSTDPWHFDVLVRVVVEDDLIQPRIEFNAQVLDQDKMEEVADVFWRRVQVGLSYSDVKHVN